MVVDAMFLICKHFVILAQVTHNVKKNVSTDAGFIKYLVSVNGFIVSFSAEFKLQEKNKHLLIN